ncbi:hypothetical protein Q9295_12640 [Xinfangfangia sp. CPCC 101601]|uniref:Uncharacterized protein n=1 Tax=Pseudogemmobacter lacusdianii TaxID=3069608 RepID=A0ABU0VZN9_9RHOB|nr:hypothetical protein [Xinfangfangia sp. CPCC 101601]MDQ2067219.1 hypothetical protein [Xinfangfangia sp. CPCC 101601]
MGQLAGLALVFAAMLAVFAGAIRLSRHLLGEDGLLVGVLIGGITNALVLYGVQHLAQVVARKVQKAQQRIEANE